MMTRKAFYYTAWILRAGKRVLRQGTVLADDELDAIDRVYEMGEVTWNRPVVEIAILGNGTGEVLATSTSERRHLDKLSPRQQNLLPAPQKEAKEDPPKAANEPWRQTTFWPSEVGRYFSPEPAKFPMMILPTK